MIFRRKQSHATKISIIRVYGNILEYFRLETLK